VVTSANFDEEVGAVTMATVGGAMGTLDSPLEEVSR